MTEDTEHTIDLDAVREDSMLIFSPRTELLITVGFLALLGAFALGYISIHIVVALGAINVVRSEYPQIRQIGYDTYLSRYNIKLPSLRDVGFIFAGIIGYYVTLVILFTGVMYFGFLSDGGQTASHAISEGFNGSTPAYYVLFYVAAFYLLFAPIEEIIFRHTFQYQLPTSLVKRVVIANSVFALVHIPIYVVGGLPSVKGLIFVLIVLFFAGAWYGLLYEWTENLTVPIIAHGTVNSIAVCLLFFA